MNSNLREVSHKAYPDSHKMLEVKDTLTVVQSKVWYKFDSNDLKKPAKSSVPNTGRKVNEKKQGRYFSVNFPTNNLSLYFLFFLYL